MNIGGGDGFKITKKDVEDHNLASLGYDGISLDVESTHSTVNDILGALEAAKKQGLTTHVTVAHSGYDIKKDMMITILKSANLDVVSPQLYTQGLEIQDLPAGSAGAATWDDWKEALAEASAKIIPGVPLAEYPSKVDEACLQKWCAETFGKQCDGYISWEAEPNAKPGDGAWSTPC